MTLADRVAELEARVAELEGKRSAAEPIMPGAGQNRSALGLPRQPAPQAPGLRLAFTAEDLATIAALAEHYREDANTALRRALHGFAALVLRPPAQLEAESSAEVVR